MEKYNLRLGSTITFDAEQERDLIDKIEYLSGRHKLGEVISNLLRIAFESPNKLSSREQLESAMHELDDYGMSQSRAEFFEKASRDMDCMKAKVDKIYEMNLKLLTLASFGKQMCLEQKTDNMLMAQFVLEQQLKSLSDTLGIDNVNHVFESNKVQDTHDLADSILEYIIETYDGIVKEIKEVASSNTVKTSQVTSNMTTEKPDTANETLRTDKDTTKAESSEFSLGEDTDETIDFGNADLDALNNFFGGSDDN